MNFRGLKGLINQSRVSSARDGIVPALSVGCQVQFRCDDG